MSNNIDVRIIARADTKAARKEIDALAAHVRAANRDQRNALNIITGSGLNTAPIARISNEIDQLTGRLHKGKLAAGDFSRIWSQRASIIRRQSELASAGIATMNDEIRGIKSGALIMDDFSKAQVRLIDQLRLGSQLMKAQATRVVDLGKNIQWAGRQITVGFTVPLGIAAGLAAREFMKVEDQIVRFQKVFNEDLGTPIDEATDRVRNLSKEIVTGMGRAQEETLEVAATFAQMGKNIDEVERMTAETMRLSTLGEVPIETSTDLIRSLQAVYRFNNEELTKSIDLLNAIENNTSLTVAAMADAMPQIVPIFKQFNLELGEGTAILAGMNEILGNANEAATAFKAISQRMFDPTQEAIDKFAEFGIDLEQIVANNADDLVGFLVDLGDILETNNVTAQQFAETFGNLMGVRQAGRGLSLITQTRDAIRGIENDTSRAFDRIGKDTRNAADAQREMQAQLSSTSNRFRRALQEMKVDIVEWGRIFLEMSLPIIEWVSNMVKWFTSLDDSTKTWIARIMGLVALIGPIKMFSGIFLNMIGTVMKMFANVLPGATFAWTEQSKAAQLAAQQTAIHDREARELIGSLFLLQNELNKTTQANNLFATSASQAALATGAMAGNPAAIAALGAMGRGGTGTQRYRIPKGMPGAGQFTTKQKWIEQYSPEGRLASARSPQRAKTSIGGTLGALPMLSFAVSSLLASTGKLESSTAQVMNNIVMWGSGLAMAIPMMSRLFARSGKIASLFMNTGIGLSKMLSTLSGGRIAALGAGKAAGVIGSTTILGAVTAVGIGIKLWFDRIDAAARKMRDFRDISKEAEQVFGLASRKASITVVDPETGEETEKEVQDAINLGLSTIEGANQRTASRRARTLVLDVLLRGGDIQLVREMMDAMNKKLNVNIDLNTTDLETALDGLRESFKRDANSIIQAFSRGDRDPSFLGRTFQGRDASLLGQQEIGELANIFATTITSGDIELMRTTVESMEKMTDAMSEQQVMLFIDKMAEFLEMPELATAETIPDALSRLVLALGSESGLAEVAATSTQEVHRYKLALEEADAAYREHAFNISRMRIGPSIQQILDEIEERGIDAANKMQEISEKLAAGLTLSADEMEWLSEVAEDAGVSQDALNNIMLDGSFAAPVFADALRGLVNMLHILGIGLREEERALAMADQARIRRQGRENQAKLEADLAKLEAKNWDFSHLDVDTPLTDGEDEDEGPGVDLGAKRSEIDNMINELVQQLTESFDEMKDQIKERYDDEIEAIKETTKLAKERDEALKKAFEDELERQRRLQKELQTSIDYDAAIARGDLDAAAALNQENMFGSIEEGYQEFIDALSERSDERDKAADKEIEAVESERDAALDAHDKKVEAIEEELEVLNRTTPATIGEWRKRVSDIDAIVRKHGLNMNEEVRKFGVEGFDKAIDNWQVKVAEDARWQAMEDALNKKGKAQGEALGKGMNDAVEQSLMDLEEMVSMKLFGTGHSDILKFIESNITRPDPGNPDRTYGGGGRTEFYHGGGKIRGQGEVPIIAQSDEYMMQRSAVKRYGLQFMEAINAGRFHEGGLVPGESKFGGIFGMFDMFMGGLYDGFARLGQMFSGAGMQLGGIAAQAQSGGGGGFGSGFNVQHSGGGGALSIPQIFNLARSVGLSKSQAQLATAIALGESGGRPGAVGDVNLQNSKWGPSVGLWQVRSLWAQRGTGAARDLDRLKDPAFNARAMYEISNGGTNWYPWTVWKENMHQKFMSDVINKTMHLDKGGLLKSDAFANLHKGEAVLRAPIASALEAGIRNMQSGNMGNTYIFDIGEYHGTEENLQRFTKHVIREIDKRENARGRQKVYGR